MSAKSRDNHDSTVSHTLPSTDVRQLLEAVVGIGASAATLSERRQKMLELLGQMMDADCGHWSWGRGNPVTSSVAPLAILDFGYTPERMALLIEGSLDPEMDRTFRVRVMSQPASQLYSSRHLPRSGVDHGRQVPQVCAEDGNGLLAPYGPLRLRRHLVERVSVAGHGQARIWSARDGDPRSGDGGDRLVAQMLSHPQ